MDSGPRVMPRSGRRLMSTSRSGARTPPFIRSTCAVPPARYEAVGSAVTRATASSTVSARMYSNVRIGGSARCHVADRREDVRIGTAATNISAHELADVVIGIRAHLIEQRHRREDLSRRAVTALKAVVTDE